MLNCLFLQDMQKDGGSCVPVMQMPRCVELARSS